MANEVEICNIALARVGANPMQSMDERTAEARACRTFYPMCRDAVLRDHDWGFARKLVAMAVVREDYRGWVFAYSRPADCLAAREVYNAAKSSSVDMLPFELAVDDDGITQLVLCDIEAAQLLYTFKATNSSIYDSLMIEALSYRLASDLAKPLRGDTQGSQLYFQMYQQAIGKSKAAGYRERYEAPSLDSDLLSARA